VGIIREVLVRFQKDRALSQGAALAYYAVFSIAPLLVLVIAIAGMGLGRVAAEGEIIQKMREVVGSEGASMIETMIREVMRPASGIVATMVSFATMFVGASGAFGQLQTTLNDIFRAEPRRGGMRGVLRQRLMAFAMILGIGFLLLVSLALSAVLSAAHQRLIEYSPAFGPSLPMLNFGVSFVVLTALFALVYKVLPDVNLHWYDVTLGAAVTSILFIVGESLLGLYLERAGAISVYGAAGSLVLLLLWIYYSAQILLLGAEFTEVFSRRYGSRRLPAETSAVSGEAHG
jgi:membrane protein